jgi:hypothetical protein
VQSSRGQWVCGRDNGSNGSKADIDDASWDDLLNLGATPSSQSVSEGGDGSFLRLARFVNVGEHQPEVAKKGDRNMSESWAKPITKPYFPEREQASAPSPTDLQVGVPRKVLAVMVTTTVLTLATLTTGYEIFFSHSAFA